MKEDREDWLGLLFSKDVEGGWSDRDKKDDPGGATMRGITLGCYQDYTNNPEATKEELKQISEETARKIAITMFWNPVSGDMLPRGVAIVVADCAFHSHWSRAAMLLQELLPGVEVDGFVGEKTISAVRKADPVKLINDYTIARLEFMQGLKNWAANANGWTKRVKLMRARALEVVQKRPGLVAAATSPTILVSAGGAATATAGIAYSWDQLGVPMMNAIKGVIGEESVKKLQSADEVVKSTGQMDPLTGGLFLVIFLVQSGYTIYRQARVWYQGWNGKM